MKVTINGSEDFFKPRLVLGTMGKGMNSSLPDEFLLPGDFEDRLITIDLSEEEVTSMSYFDLTSYMLGFKAGESHVRNQF